MQELDEICNVCEWVLPRYTIHPSVADGIYKYLLYLIIILHEQALGPWTI
jgi:hypothetical protein